MRSFCLGPVSTVYEAPDLFYSERRDKREGLRVNVHPQEKG